NHRFIGNSPEAKRINRAIKKFAKVDSSVLLVGETGVGKEYIAEKIHLLSSRKNRPFVSINCSALGYTIGKRELFGEETEANGTIQRTIGLLEKANNGVLFLDYIDETPLEHQFELLQVIREMRFRRVGGKDNIPLDVRIISACNGEMEHNIESKKFRKDLYFLLKTLSITVPALKSRKQDIPELFIYFLKNYCHENQLDIPAVPAEIFESILEYDWKGNIRELKDCVENLVMMSPEGELSTEFLPFKTERHPLDFLEIGNLKGVISDVEIYLIKKALGKFAGNQVKAARCLGVPEATLRFKMKKYAIHRD
ncbi:sigma-54-dependent Fis family transcriptional regulator, partial [candidate division KSB1 bacterium]|nr:sigma-54-dependent Fis family transcriptional regulator [candidate division KSB1 bacterium]